MTAQDATRITDGAHKQKNWKKKNEGKKKITESKPKTKPKPKSLGAKPIKAGQHVSGILCPLSRFKVISYD